MSRFFQTILFIAALSTPSLVFADQALPSVIETALHDAAGTGNPLVVDAVADRMGNLFPFYRGQINTYVVTIVEPATQVMAGVNSMLADLPTSNDQGLAMLYDHHNMTEESEAASLAADLNDLDVGAGDETISAIQ